MAQLLCQGPAAIDLASNRQALKIRDSQVATASLFVPASATAAAHHHQRAADHGIDERRPACATDRPPAISLTVLLTWLCSWSNLPFMPSTPLPEHVCWPHADGGAGAGPLPGLVPAMLGYLTLVNSRRDAEWAAGGTNAAGDTCG
jgi:hypothetical protein